MTIFGFANDNYAPSGSFGFYGNSAVFVFDNSNYAPAGQFVFGDIASLSGILAGDLWLDGSGGCLEK
jgi:hypothetical protein